MGNLYKFILLLLGTTPIHFNAQHIINHTPPLSQNTNHYLSQHSDKRLFISSIDGLNIFDGSSIKIYKSTTHNLLGDNIQSPFFEDANQNMWFATYEGIHCYEKQFG